MSYSLVDVFRDHVNTRGDRVAYRFSNGRELTATFTFADVDRAARSIAVALQQRCNAGDRVLLAVDSGADFVRAFFGCLYAGTIAVPLSAPTQGRGMARIRAVADNASARLVLTDDVARVGELEALGIASVDITSLLLAGSDPALFRDVGLRPEDVAFLQYTSGSTGAPKGVVVTHANLLANEEMIRASCSHDEDSVFVGWLPLFHDMGLVGNILQPAYVGIPSILMSPRAFIRRPLRWLQLISEFRATTSGGPSFAYDTCVRRIDDAQLQGLDLGSWRIAFNGAEPIRARTMRAFSQKFGSVGFSYKAFYPVYGLAEATLMVTAPDAGANPRVRRVPADALEQGMVPKHDSEEMGASRCREVVSCGPPRGDQRVRIVQVETHAPLAERQVGEIWVTGPNVTRGYWNNAALSERVYGATTPDGDGPFLRTGDLGFLEGGQLYVTGRMKDLLIVNGMNHYPQDVEHTVTACDDLFAGRQAAALALQEDERDMLVVLQEVPRTFLGRRSNEECDAMLRELKARIRLALQAEHGLSPRSILLVRQGALPVTTSGKIQRSRCRELLARGELKEIQAAGAIRVGAASSADAARAVRR